MYSPEMMKMAQEQMSKMSPEQMQKMQEMAKNMDPETVKAAQASMSNMNPDMMKQAMGGQNMEEQMKRMESMTPEQLKQQTEYAARMGGAARAPAPAPAPLKPSTDPAVIAAVALKDAGTALLKTSDFNAAAKSYADAVDKLDDATDTVGKQPVWTACQLNMAHAHLQAENWQKASAACDRVCDSRSAMESSATRLKAHYRRGRARKGLGQLSEAADDLKIAKGLAGAKERGAIAELLSAVNKELGVHEKEIPAGKGGARIEEIDADDSSSVAAQMGNMDPAMMKQQMEMMDNMDDAALENMAKMTSQMRPGMPQMDAKSMRAQVNMMKNMDPEAMKKMTEMAKGMGGMGGAGAGGGQPSAADAAKMMESMSPDQLKGMAESMKSMDPEMLKQAAEAAGMDMPDIDPAMMAQAAEQMGNLTPEQMQKMMKVANYGQKCMSVCARPLAVWKWFMGWIPAEYRRSVYMGLGAVLVYWLFMGGSSAPPPGPPQSNDPDFEDPEGIFCDSDPCHNDAKCVDVSDGYECECLGEFSGDNCETDDFFGESFE